MTKFMIEPIVLANNKQEAKMVEKAINKASSPKILAKIKAYDQKNTNTKIQKLTKKQIKELCASL